MTKQNKSPILSPNPPLASSASAHPRLDETLDSGASNLPNHSPPDQQPLTPAPPFPKINHSMVKGKLLDPWSYDLTCKLINLRLGKYRREFMKFSPNDRERSSVWDQINSDLGNPYNGKKVAKKFRDMHSQYTTKKQKENRSGGEGSTWIYMQVFDAHTGGELEEDPEGKKEVGGCLPPNLLSFLDEEDRKDLTGDKMDIEQEVVCKSAKKRKETVKMRDKVEELQAITLGKYIESLDDKKEQKKELAKKR